MSQNLPTKPTTARKTTDNHVTNEVDAVPLDLMVLEKTDDFDSDEAHRRDPVFQSIYKKYAATWKLWDGYSISVDTMQFETSMGVMTCIPASPLKEILHLTHDTFGHGGHKKTFDQITSQYYSPKLVAYV